MAKLTKSRRSTNQGDASTSRSPPPLAKKNSRILLTSNGTRYTPVSTQESLRPESTGSVPPNRWQHQSVATLAPDPPVSRDPRSKRWTHQSAVTLKDEPAPCAEKCGKCGKQKRPSVGTAAGKKPVSNPNPMRPLQLVEQVKADQATLDRTEAEQPKACKDGQQCVRCSKQKRPGFSPTGGLKPLDLVDRQVDERESRVCGEKCQKCGKKKRPASLPAGPSPLRQHESAHVRTTSNTSQTSAKILPILQVTATIPVSPAEHETCGRCGKPKRPIGCDLPPSSAPSDPDLQSAAVSKPQALMTDDSPLLARRADRYLPKTAYERQRLSQQYQRSMTGNGLGETMNSLIRRVSSRGHKRNVSNPTPYKQIYHGPRDNELFLGPMGSSEVGHSSRELLSRPTTNGPIHDQDFGEHFSRKSLDLRDYSWHRQNIQSRDTLDTNQYPMPVSTRYEDDGHQGWYGYGGMPGNHGNNL